MRLEVGANRDVLVTNQFAVDFEKAGAYDVLLVHRLSCTLEDVACNQAVDAAVEVLLLSAELSSHGVGLAGARLTVSETGGHTAFEDCWHERLGGEPVDHLVADDLVKDVVESELEVVQVLSHVHLEKQNLFTGDFCVETFHRYLKEHLQDMSSLNYR